MQNHLKVMFTFQGLPHYYNYVLNRLDALPGIEVVNVVASKSTGMGAGVFQTKADIQFRLYELAEYHVPGGGDFLRSLWRVVIKERPDIIVMTPAHGLGFVRNVPMRILRRVLGIKLILKSIPFRLRRRDAWLRELQEAAEAATASSSPFVANICRFAAPLVGNTESLERVLNKLHRPLRKRIASAEGRAALHRTTRLHRFPDAHVNYVEEGRDIIGSYGVDTKRIFVTYNSPDTDRLFAVREALQGSVEKHSHRIIHVGRLAQWKRVDLLLEAFALLVRDFPDAELLVVGDGPQREAWETLRDALGLSDSVQFLGNVHDPSELGRLLMSSALYVLAGMGGLSINDAMCFGLPVICSVCDGTEKKLVRDGWNGSYFIPGNVRSLHETMKRLLGDQATLTLMGQRSLDIIRHEINIDTVLHGYVKAFEYVTGKQIAT